MKFEIGDNVERCIGDRDKEIWIGGYTVIELPKNFVPLGNCIYVQHINGDLVGVPPELLRLDVNPKVD